jgi:hypothetical protein
MTLFDIFMTQLADPFRIALMIGLVLTAMRTAAISGTMLPLLAGVLFVAVIIPTTLNPNGQQAWTQVGVGLVTNLVMLAAILALKTIWDRFRR